jgi:hypothetical protein
MVKSSSPTLMLLGLVWLVLVGLPQPKDAQKQSRSAGAPTKEQARTEKPRSAAKPFLPPKQGNREANAGGAGNRQTNAAPTDTSPAVEKGNEIPVIVRDKAENADTSPSPEKEDKKTPPEEPEGGFFPTISVSTLLWGAAIFGSLLVSGSMSLLVWWKNKDLESLLLRTRREIEAKTYLGETQVETLKDEITNCKSALNSLRSNIPPDLTYEVHNLKQQLQYLGSQRPGEAPPNHHAPPVPTVKYYLNQVGNSVVRAETAFMRGDTLTQDGDGKFALLPLRQEGQYFAIPFYERFGSAQDFSHYQKFYQCDQPSAGEIIVLDPAIVDFDTVSREWNLRKRGVLQINA